MPASVPATVSFIGTARDAGERAREVRFLRELRLVLDEIGVREIGPAPPEFAGQGLGPQIQWVRSQLRSRPALAALWLSQPSPDLLLLQLVSVSTGRALVRLVEAASSAGAEHQLALSARELLGTAYLFVPGQRRPPAAVARVVASLPLPGAAPAPAPASRTPWLPRWSVGLSGRFQVGVWGMTTGLTMATGTGLDAELALGNDWLARARLDLLARPLGEADGASLSGMGVDPGVELGRAWHFGPSLLVVLLGCRLAWTVAWVRPEGGAAHRLSWSEVQLGAAVELRWKLRSRLYFVADVEFLGTPERHRLRLLSSRESVVTTPWLSAGFSLGLRFGGR